MKPPIAPTRLVSARRRREPALRSEPAASLGLSHRPPSPPTTCRNIRPDRLRLGLGTTPPPVENAAGPQTYRHPSHVPRICPLQNGSVQETGPRICDKFPASGERKPPPSR